MRTFQLFFIFIMMLISAASAQEKPQADLLVTGGRIYSVDEKNSVYEAMAIREGKILALGTSKDILQTWSGKIMDVRGKIIFPGFIDAHSHFYGYALGFQQADLTGTRSFDEVLAKMQLWSAKYPGEWLVGRGWDHNTWLVKEFPDRKRLDEMFPDRPVVLIRIDGHVVLANGEALKRAGIAKETAFSSAEAEEKNGHLTGILSENAADFMRNAIPPPDRKSLVALLREAEGNCFAAGLTTVNDAGTDKKIILLLDSLQKSGDLSIRLSVMLNPTEENVTFFMKNGVYRTEKMTAGAVKMYADGSLGSRTALLKQPYSDDPSKSGILANPEDRIRKYCELCLKYGFQMNIHAIGDSAVAMVLHIYGDYLKGKNDLRWRIEHSQVVDPADIALFGKYSVIPSIQATHATSDMYWAGSRLGQSRVAWAYAYGALLQQNGWLPNGTDFPIEKINPLNTFYAAVARKDLKGFPEGGFQKENSLTREQALRSITIWAAKGSFDEGRKGSLEAGKFADFVILNQDLLRIPEELIPQTKVLETFVGGIRMFGVTK